MDQVPVGNGLVCDPVEKPAGPCHDVGGHTPAVPFQDVQIRAEDPVKMEAHELELLTSVHNPPGLADTGTFGTGGQQPMAQSMNDGRTDSGQVAGA